MRWRHFFGLMTDEDRRAAAAPLKSLNEENATAQQSQVVVVSAADVRRGTAQMYVDQAKAQAEKYAEAQNRARARC